VRQGVSLQELTEKLRETALGVLRAGRSAEGLTLTRDIMRLNHTLAELNDNNFDEYGEWMYHVTVMGTPSATEPWGWQFDGHHAIINYFVLGDLVVMTPLFLESEPATAPSGTYQGTTIMRAEQSQALAFVNGLAEPQRAQAVLTSSKTNNTILTEAWRDNMVLDDAGVPVADLAEPQRQQLLALIGLYVGNQTDGHARVRMDEVRRHLDRIAPGALKALPDGGRRYGTQPGSAAACVTHVAICASSTIASRRLPRALAICGLPPASSTTYLLLRAAVGAVLVARGRTGFAVWPLCATAAFTRALNARASTVSPSWMSIARCVPPSKPALKSPAGSSSAAPLAKVSFTLSL